ncbi:MAG: hypothetical protein LBJ00_15755 [Planctomycetaceae bacterium]|nr:hypothetical protein [Planctomycetaceae bacterium]
MRKLSNVSKPIPDNRLCQYHPPYIVFGGQRCLRDTWDNTPQPVRSKFDLALIF